MRILLLINLVALLFLTGCSDDDDEKKKPDPLWIGTWVETIVETGCETILTIQKGDSFLWSSLDERQSGIYTVSNIESEKDAYLLELDFKEDNGLSNCDGDSVNDVGLLTTTIGFPDENTMTWIFGGEVMLTFLRDVEKI